MFWPKYYFYINSETRTLQKKQTIRFVVKIIYDRIQICAYTTQFDFTFGARRELSVCKHNKQENILIIDLFDLTLICAI